MLRGGLDTNTVNHFALVLYVVIDWGFHRSKAVDAQAVNFVSVTLLRNGSCLGAWVDFSMFKPCETFVTPEM